MISRVCAASAAILGVPFLAASSAAAFEAVVATEPEINVPLLVSDDACLGAGADTEQCSVSLRQLRGEQRQQQQPMSADLDPRGSSVKAEQRSTSMGYSSMSSGMAPNLGPAGVRVNKKKTGAGTDYKPDNQELFQPSPAPLLKFYMYRAASEERYRPLSTNAANLPGVLWYLHHEVVVQNPRKFRISKIVRFLVQVRATKPLYDKGMNFGVRGAFDRGQATGPFLCGKHVSNGTGHKHLVEPKFCSGRALTAEHLKSLNENPGKPLRGPWEWSQYGYFVGCNKLGNFPFPTYPVHYPGATWYSLPGACTSTQFWNQTERCAREEPGGWCPGTPTGTGDCTWNYKHAGEISINELVGISEREWPHFRKSGKKEYDPFKDQGRHFSWWNHINSEHENTRRIKAAQRLFRHKFPQHTPDENMQQPPCDFNEKVFYGKYYVENPHYCKGAWQVPACKEAIQRARDLVFRDPDKYPNVTVSSPDLDFQKILYEENTGHCPKPCS